MGVPFPQVMQKGRKDADAKLKRACVPDPAFLGAAASSKTSMWRRPALANTRDDDIVQSAKQLLKTQAEITDETTYEIFAISRTEGRKRSVAQFRLSSPNPDRVSRIRSLLSKPHDASDLPGNDKASYTTSPTDYKASSIRNSSLKRKTTSTTNGHKSQIPEQPMPQKLAVKHFQIQDTDRFVEFVRSKISGSLQQMTLKVVLKAWIKEIEPKKQSKYPYKSRGGKESTESRRAPWWPLFIAHLEPDHGHKEDRIKLFEHFLLFQERCTEPDTRPQNFRGPGGGPEAMSGWVECLRRKVDTCRLLSEGEPQVKDDERREQLEIILDVAQKRLEWFEGCLDGETEITYTVVDKQKLKKQKKEKSTSSSVESSSKKRKLDSGVQASKPRAFNSQANGPVGVKALPDNLNTTVSPSMSTDTPPSLQVPCGWSGAESAANQAMSNASIAPLYFPFNDHYMADASPATSSFGSFDGLPTTTFDGEDLAYGVPREATMPSDTQLGRPPHAFHSAPLGQIETMGMPDFVGPSTADVETGMAFLHTAAPLTCIPPSSSGPQMMSPLMGPACTFASFPPTSVATAGNAISPVIENIKALDFSGDLRNGHDSKLVMDHLINYRNYDAPSINDGLDFHASPF